MGDRMNVPQVLEIKKIIEETPTIKTFIFDWTMVGENIPTPGQFVMVWNFKDEKPMSISYIDVGKGELGITVKKVGEDYESLNFNTAISQMMIFINAVYKQEVFPSEYALGFLKLLNPIAPHITEELNELLGNSEILATSSWPKYEDSKLVVNTIEMAVQVNGKLRGTIKVNKDEDDEVVKAAAFELDNVKSNTEGKEIKKVIVVKNRIVNIVAI